MTDVNRVPESGEEDDGGRHAKITRRVPIKKIFPNLDPVDLMQIGTTNSFNDPVALSLMEWTERDRASRSQTEDSLRLPPETELPPYLAKLGLEFRPQKPLDYQTTAKELSLAKHPRTFYEDTCKDLLNGVHNTASRMWAIREFFYGDIDKEWYSKRDMAALFSKLGIPITLKTRLTKREWSLVRQKIRRRPRLFSKKFIAEQLKERNKHRSLVRQLQQDPEVEDFSSIPVGSIVTAYNKKFKTICKGNVLQYDPRKFEYLIQFNSPEYGFEICPDAEVSVAAAETTDKTETESDVEISEEKGSTDEEVEREIVVTLLAIVKQSFERKRAILKALDHFADSSKRDDFKYVSWLLANLERVNRTLKAALIHMQVMYGCDIFYAHITEKNIGKRWR